MERLTAEEIREMYLFAAERIVASEEYLTEIDLKIGDGDHGTGMAWGFKHVLSELPKAEISSAESVFYEIGNILLDTMGGASGVLFGTLFISGIIRREPKDYAVLKDFANILKTSLNAIKERGKAKVGDKTMIDALEPAVMVLEQGACAGMNLDEGFSLAAKRSKEGVENTKKLTARFGRAKYYGEQSLGHQDAGATSVWILFQAMADFLKVERK